MRRALFFLWFQVFFGKIILGDRFAYIKTLNFIAPCFAQEIKLFFGFHTFSHGLEVEAVGQRQNGPDNGVVFGLFGDVIDCLTSAPMGQISGIA
jgi:hypothetical protein